MPRASSQSTWHTLSGAMGNSSFLTRTTIWCAQQSICLHSCALRTVADVVTCPSVLQVLNDNGTYYIRSMRGAARWLLQQVRRGLCIATRRAAPAVSGSSGALSRLGCFVQTDAVVGKAHCKAEESSVALRNLMQCCVCRLQEQPAPAVGTIASLKHWASASAGLRLPAVKTESGGQRKAVTPGTPPDTPRSAVAAQQDASPTASKASVTRTHSIRPGQAIPSPAPTRVLLQAS